MSNLEAATVTTLETKLKIWAFILFKKLNKMTWRFALYYQTEVSVLAEYRGLSKTSRWGRITCESAQRLQCLWKQHKNNFCDCEAAYSLLGRRRSLFSDVRRLQSGWQTMSCSLLWSLHRHLMCSILCLQWDQVKLDFKLSFAIEYEQHLDKKSLILTKLAIKLWGCIMHFFRHIFEFHTTIIQLRCF